MTRDEIIEPTCAWTWDEDERCDVCWGEVQDYPWPLRGPTPTHFAKIKLRHATKDPYKCLTPDV